MEAPDPEFLDAVRANHEMMGDIAAEVQDEAFRAAAGASPPTPWEDAMGFYHAVSWSREPWLQALLAAEAALFVLVLATRRHPGAQFALFGLQMLVLALLEPANTWAQAHWEQFATQDYFDPRGVFLAVIVATPLLGTLFLQLGFFLIDMTRLMVVVKRKQFQAEARAKSKSDKSKGKAE